ncbi:MAG: DUF126 domain-containing protein [Dehalobacterium sp.]
MEKIIINGRPAMGGIIEAQALVFPDSLAGNSGSLEDKTGVVREKGNPNWGFSINGSILVLPCAKGSNGFSAHFKAAKISGVCPAGWVITKIDSRLGVAVASLEVPAVTEFDGIDPVNVIKTGDWVKIDGDTGVVEITRKAL